MKKNVALKTLASLICLAPVLAFGAGTAKEADPDTVFLQKASQGGIAEINSGRVAASQASNAAVKSLASMLAQESARDQDTLRSLADSKSVVLPSTETPEQSAKMSRVKGLSGDAFDRAYVGWQIMEHKQAIALFEEESTSGDDRDVKQFATDTLPTLRAHLKLLEAVVLPPPAVAGQSPVGCCAGAAPAASTP